MHTHHNKQLDQAAKPEQRKIEGRMLGVFLGGCLLGFLNSGVEAAPKEYYKCGIKQYFNLEVSLGNTEMTVDGPMVRGDPAGSTLKGGEEAIANFWAKKNVGQEFVVNTQTGIIEGSDPPANNEAEKRIILVDGSDEMSFTLLSIWGPIPATQYLEIKTFARSEEKPFIFIRDGSTFTGECR